MNETKRVWEDVAAILAREGWLPPGDHQEPMPSERSQRIQFPAIPTKKEPLYYRWLPAGVIVVLVGCFLAIFLEGKFGKQPPDDTALAALQQRLAGMEERAKVLEQQQSEQKVALGKAENSFTRAIAKIDTTSDAIASIERSVKSLEGNDGRLKEELEVVAKSLRALKEGMAADFSALNDRLKQEKEQRSKAIDDLKKRFDRMVLIGYLPPNEIIAGEWKLRSIEREGSNVRGLKAGVFIFKPVKPSSSEGTFTIEGDKKFEEKKALTEGKYVIRRHEGLILIDLKWAKGEADTVKVFFGVESKDLQEGIVEVGLDGTLKMILAPSGQRPKELSVRGNPRATLLTLTRTETPRKSTP